MILDDGAELKLRPGLLLLTSGESDLFVLSSGPDILALRPTFGKSIIARTLQAMARGASVGEVLDRLGPVERQIATDVLTELLASGALTRARTEVSGDERNRDVAVGDLAVEHPSASLDLEGSHVALIGLGRAGVSVAQALVDLGVGSLSCFDEDVVERRDLAAWAYREADLGLPRKDVLCAALRDAGVKTKLTACAIDDLETALEAASVDIIVVASDVPQPGLWDGINRLSMRTKVPWTSYRAMWGGGHPVEIGPTVFPHETPCFECFRTRRLANLDDAEADSTIESAVRAGTAFAGFDRGFHTLADVVALEAARAIRGGPCLTVGAVVTFAPESVELIRRPVLKIPGCVVCASSRASENRSHVRRMRFGQSDSGWPLIARVYHEQSRVTRHGAVRPEFLSTPLHDRYAPLPGKSYVLADRLSLPEATVGDMSLRETVERRHTTRSFGGVPLELDDVTAILRLAYGVATDGARRGVPSGGGMYPLELYLLPLAVTGLRPGVYHYAAEEDALEQLPEVLCPPIAECINVPELATTAAAAIVICGVLERSAKKYGELAYRLMLLEAGHVGQNIVLGATALGLGVLPYAGFYNDLLEEHLHVNPADERALYMLWLGLSPNEDERVEKNH